MWLTISCNLAILIMSLILCVLSDSNFNHFSIVYFPYEEIIYIVSIWCFIVSFFWIISFIARNQKTFMKISIFLDYLTINLLLILGIYLIIFKTNNKDEFMNHIFHPLNFIFSIID